MGPNYGIQIEVANSNEYGFNHSITVKQQENTLCIFYCTTKDLLELKENIVDCLNNIPTPEQPRQAPSPLRASTEREQPRTHAPAPATTTLEHRTAPNTHRNSTRTIIIGFGDTPF